MRVNEQRELTRAPNIKINDTNKLSLSNFPDVADTSKPPSRSHDSGSSAGIATASKPRARFQCSSSSSDNFDTDSEDESTMSNTMTQDHNLTTSDTLNSPTIELTNINMTSENNESPPS